MSGEKKFGKVISDANVSAYIDSSSDGGYWYKIREGVPEFVAITDKALKVFGFDSLDELKMSGKSPYELALPLNPDLNELQVYKDFLAGKGDRFAMEVHYVNTAGKEAFGEIFVAKSVVFEQDSEEMLYRVMMHVYPENESVFKQSRSLLEHLSTGIAILKINEDKSIRPFFFNNALLKALGYTSDEITDNNIEDLIYEDDLETVRKCYYKAIKTRENNRETYRMNASDGSYIWVKADHKMIELAGTKYIYSSLMGVSDLMTIQNDIKNSNDRLEEVINATPAGILVINKVDDGYSISAVNDTFVNKLNMNGVYIKKDEPMTKYDYIGFSLEDIAKAIAPMDQDLFYRAMHEAEKEGEAEFNFKLNTNRDKYTEPVWIHCRAISRPRKAGGIQLISAYEDITKQIQIEEELKTKQLEILNMSYHDPLTDVLNRQSYNEFMKQRGRGRFSNTGVAFVDLNGLKNINDLYGHAKGDDALRLTVMLMEHYFDKDEIYRISGDNFVVIKEDIESDAFYGKMGKLLAEFTTYDIASVGYNWDENVPNITKAVNKAEEAMRVAKQEYYARHREDESKHRPTHLNELMSDIKNGRYMMFLQPKANTDSTKVIAAEALIRKIDEKGDMVPPMEFVPILEKEKLVPYLDFFMLNETCKTLERWKKENRQKLKISVNMSRVTLAEPDYINKVLSVTDRYDIDHSQVEFEITESQETMDRHTLEKIVEQIAELGFGVSLDDMGTEYSSVMMLTMNGLDTVKIDRGFVLQMNTEKGRMLVEHIIQMCHDLGELCIAEGVEDHDTRIMLHTMGCDMYQGYLLAKPIPVAEFETLIDPPAIQVV